jgi:hypothetical protein
MHCFSWVSATLQHLATWSKQLIVDIKNEKAVRVWQHYTLRLGLTWQNVSHCTESNGNGSQRTLEYDHWWWRHNAAIRRILHISVTWRRNHWMYSFRIHGFLASPFTWPHSIRYVFVGYAKDNAYCSKAKPLELQGITQEVTSEWTWRPVGRMQSYRRDSVGHHHECGGGAVSSLGYVLTKSR